MSVDFDQQIASALGAALRPEGRVAETGSAELPSCFRVSDLAVASLSAATGELMALTGAQSAALDRRLALIWFGKTLQPLGWQLPPQWDPIAGDYRTSDGWIRLHTNAPHHRDAAIAALGCRVDRAEVAQAAAGWTKSELESAVIAAGGAAAAMHRIDEWADHPQGRSVAAEPLIAWRQSGAADRRVTLDGLRVLDLTRVLAGPVATRFLAGFGANVLRIDPPSWNEPGVEAEVTLGKRRAGLDLTKAGDRRIFQDLLSGADLLVHGYRPGALEALGYDEATRQRLSPGLSDISLCAYGWTGPWRDRRGFDSLVQMSSGIADQGMRRAKADRPVPLPVQALDHATGYLMAAAALRRDPATSTQRAGHLGAAVAGAHGAFADRGGRTRLSGRRSWGSCGRLRPRDRGDILGTGPQDEIPRDD